MLKQACSYCLPVCLSMYGLLLRPGLRGLSNALLGIGGCAGMCAGGGWRVVGVGAAGVCGGGQWRGLFWVLV